MLINKLHEIHLLHADSKLLQPATQLLHASYTFVHAHHIFITCQQYPYYMLITNQI